MSSVWCVRQTAVSSFFFFFLSDESSELAEFSEISVRHLTALSRAPHWSWSRVAGAAPPPSRPPTPPPSTLDSRSCAPTLPHPETSPTLPLQKHPMMQVLHHTKSVKCQPLRILYGSQDDPFPWPTPFIPRLSPCCGFPIAPRPVAQSIPTPLSLLFSFPTLAFYSFSPSTFTDTPKVVTWSVLLWQ